MSGTLERLGTELVLALQHEKETAEAFEHARARVDQLITEVHDSFGSFTLNGRHMETETFKLTPLADATTETLAQPSWFAPTDDQRGLD